MNFRKNTLLAFMGLSIVALGFIGCERTVVGRNDGRWVPPSPPAPATQIQVAIAGDVADLNGAKVALYLGTTRIDSTTLSGVSSSPATVTFTNVGGAGTYSIVLFHSATGYTFQSQIVTISDDRVPIAGFTLQKLASSANIEVVTNQAVDQNAVTTVTVQQPTAVKDFAPTAAPARISIAANSGVTSVTVASQTPSAVPQIITSGAVSKTVVGAIQIQANASAPNAQMTVNIPLPISSGQFTQAATPGATMEILRYNTTTQAWASLGFFPIKADGTVEANITGVDQNTILSIGSTPQVSEQKVAQRETTPVYTASEVTKLQSQGQTAVTYSQSPAVSATVSKPGTPSAKAAIRSAPTGIQEWQWAAAAPIIAQRLPELRDWIYNDNATTRLNLGQLISEIRRENRTQTFTFVHNFGGVNLTFTVRIDFRTLVIVEITHTSGFGGA